MQTIPRYLNVDDSGENSFKLSATRRYDFLNQIPERKKVDHQYQTFICPATDLTVKAIADNVHPDYLNFESPMAEALFTSVLLRLKLSEKIREQTAAYKECKVVPHHTTNFDSRLSAYQTVGALNASQADGGYGLWMEQGTGKTFTAISAIDLLPAGARVLIVAPNNVRLNWTKEIQKFSQRNTKTTVIRGTQMARISRLIDALRNDGQDASVAILGYDTIAGMWEALQMVEWDMCILDESHYIRNAKTKRWKYVQRLRSRSKKRLCLSGTPIANSVNDLYTQFEFMGEGFSGFSSFTAFKRFYGVYERQQDDSGGEYERLLGLQNVPAMKDRISRHAFLITKKEALPDLPEKVYDIDEIEMSEPQEAAYIKLASELAFEIENEIASQPNQALVVNNVLTMLLKLAQVTSGFLNIPPEKGPEGEILVPKKTIAFAPNPKIERLTEILSSKKKLQKTIVWACFEYDLLKIKSMCDVHGIDSVLFYGKTSDANRKLAEDRFNEDDNCKVFIGNPAAGGTGLNLLGYPPGFPDKGECNVDHIIYYSQDWSSLKRSQSEDRAHRRGTRNNVQITDLCIPNTIDETIRARVVEKRMSAFEITDIRNILKEIMNRD